MVLCREALRKHDRLDFYEEILGLYGARKVTSAEVMELMKDLIPAFRRSAQVTKTPFFTSGTLKEHVIPLFVAGVTEMLESGHYREALFPVLFTYWSVYTALGIDAPADEKPKWDAERKRVFDAWELGDADSVDRKSSEGLELLQKANGICLEIIIPWRIET